MMPDAQVEVDDLTGAGDHFRIAVASSVFQGKSLIDQHRLVQQTVQAAFDSGEIHAIQIKTAASRSASIDSGQDDFKVIE